MEKMIIKKIIRRYGFYGIISLMFDYIKTKIIYKRWNPRLIRSGSKIRGAKSIDIGNNFSAGFHLRIDAFGNNDSQIQIGNDVSVGDDVHITSIKKVVIGKNTLLASKIYISDHNHGVYSGSMQSNPKEIINKRTLGQKDVIIGENVWIGEFVSILPGVRLGNNSIIGSNSVVCHNIPENSIAVGIPAKVIKVWNESDEKWIKNISS